MRICIQMKNKCKYDFFFLKKKSFTITFRQVNSMGEDGQGQLSLWCSLQPLVSPILQELQ